MQAVIFDMDGLLVDSEPLWREAEVDVFGAIGVPLTQEMCRQTTGLRYDEVVRYWHARFPWEKPDREQVAQTLLDAAQRLIVERGSLLEGALDAITSLHAAGAKLAIASSSPLQLIQAVVKKFALDEYFLVLHSAADENAGKPDPAVYLTTMSLLGVEPNQCLALEDSVSGLLAARAAGATVIAVPDSESAHEPAFAEADIVLSSLAEFSIEHFLR